MLDPKQLDDLAQRLVDALPEGLKVLQEDAKRNLRAALQSGLSRLDLVTREEFDVQAAVLGRSRQKIEDLQGQIDALEQQIEQLRQAGTRD